MDLVTMILACSVYPDNSIINSMVQANTQNNPLVISGQPYKTAQEALNTAKKLRDENTSFEIGLMQIPDSLIKNKPVSMSELLRPCKNMLIATQILNQLQLECNGSEACALSKYKTGDAQSGLDYANQIIQYAQEHPFVPPPPAE
jgi:hypothetical protein